MTYDALRFPLESYTLKTKSVKTAEGVKTVEYKAYEHLPYVSKPVDADYQSMDVLVPVSIDGKAVDTTNAPIFFTIGVGGYMSCRNRFAPGETAAMPGPPPGRPAPRFMTPPGEDNKFLALAYGMVVAVPGCRGRDNRSPDGRYYGKAPAAIVDLKAAVRYIRHNAGAIPGNTERIVTTGGSAGGALSSLLGVSGNSPLYDEYLKALGAAYERDDIFAATAFSPIINLENADGAYEWEFGPFPMEFMPGHDGPVPPVDQKLSTELIEIFSKYQDGLAPMGKNGQGPLKTDALTDYLMRAYVFPSAERYISALGEAERLEYLQNTPWIRWDGERVKFKFSDYVNYFGRMKGLPAFDDFEMSMAEPIEFGSEDINARHFTEFSLRHTTGNPEAAVEPEIKALLTLMNPMCFLDNPGCAGHWWIRHGAFDNHTALPIVTNFADSLYQRGKNVDSRLVWNGGHCADDDPDGMMRWIMDISK